MYYMPLEFAFGLKVIVFLLILSFCSIKFMVFMQSQTKVLQRSCPSSWMVKIKKINAAALKALHFEPTCPAAEHYVPFLAGGTASACYLNNDLMCGLFFRSTAIMREHVRSVSAITRLG